MLVFESKVSLFYIGRARVTHSLRLSQNQNKKSCFPFLWLKNYWQLIAAPGREDSFLQECHIFNWREEKKRKGGERTGGKEECVEPPGPRPSASQTVS